MQLCTTYKKEHVNPGVLHIGFGAFHKAHQAVYFDDYGFNK
jgi:D-arabinitol 4-dehydrogenase